MGVSMGVSRGVSREGRGGGRAQQRACQGKGWDSGAGKEIVAQGRGGGSGKGRWLREGDEGMTVHMTNMTNGYIEWYNRWDGVGEAGMIGPCFWIVLNAYPTYLHGIRGMVHLPEARAQHRRVQLLLPARPRSQQSCPVAVVAHVQRDHRRSRCRSERGVWVQVRRHPHQHRKAILAQPAPPGLMVEVRRRRAV
eukprot:365013-Chlamydomonas_euryale.AAC.9